MSSGRASMQSTKPSLCLKVMKETFAAPNNIIMMLPLQFTQINVNIQHVPSSEILWWCPLCE